MVGHCATFLDLPLFSIPPLNEWIFIGEICQSESKQNSNWMPLQLFSQDYGQSLTAYNWVLLL